jgi:ubiquinone/menaquinone biosynthesis C-methylase UbiE
MLDQHTEAQKKTVQLHQNILDELGLKLKPGSDKILDFGCGDGSEVYQFRKMGYKAYGCDMDNYSEKIQTLCKEEKIIEPDETVFGIIDMINYRIPFADDTFDYIFSNQVFEHVQNYPQALSEIYRVLKPGGSSLHFFPSKYRPIECHVFVPLAGIFQGYNYLAFWAFLGIKNSFQKGLRFQNIARLNHEFLNNQTTYYTKKKIRKYVFNQFRNASFVEYLFIKHGGGRLRNLYWLSKKLPFIASLISTFHTRVLFFRKLRENPVQ